MALTLTATDGAQFLLGMLIAFGVLVYLAVLAGRSDKHNAARRGRKQRGDSWNG